MTWVGSLLDLTFVVENFPHNLLSPYDKYIILHIYLLRYLNKTKKKRNPQSRNETNKKQENFLFLLLKECSFKT